MPQESFRHWQTRSIDQKQSSSALMLGLSGAAMGFSISILPELSDQKFIGHCASIMFHLTGIALIVSMTCGILFSLNRVRDFDKTAQVARKREKKSPRCCAKRYAKRA